MTRRTLVMQAFLFLALITNLTPGALSQSALSLSANEIMHRVAGNQDRSDAERTHFVYLQHARVLSRKGKTIRCEEITDSRVTPVENGSGQQLLKLEGRLLVKGKYVAYTDLTPKADRKSAAADVDVTLNDNSTMDRDLVENMRANLTKRKSRDGVATGLFPLTSQNQQHYNFHILGRELRNGRDTFHIAFEPKDKDDFEWKGDAYIDTTAYQPVLVRTTMSRNIPFAVRTLLGTSLPGLGFTVTYAPQADDIWFPATFGSEFKMHVLFFLNREIVIGAENRDFERTHVHSTILPGLATEEPLTQQQKVVN